MAPSGPIPAADPPGEQSDNRSRSRTSSRLVAVLSIVVAVCAFVLTVAITCDPAVLGPTGSPGEESLASGAARFAEVPSGSGTRLRLVLENCEATYAPEDPGDRWHSRSWTTHDGSLDIVVTNESRRTMRDVTLLVTVSASDLARLGWRIEIDDRLLLDHASQFAATDPAEVSFDGGSHGVYPPDGDGRYVAYTRDGSLRPGGTWRVHVDIDPAGIADFDVHVDASSSSCSTDTGDDINVRPLEAGDIGAAVGGNVFPRGRRADHE